MSDKKRLVKLTECGVQDMVREVCKADSSAVTSPLVVILLSDMFRERFSHALRQARCSINYDTGVVSLSSTLNPGLVNSIRISVLTSIMDSLPKMRDVVEDHQMVINNISDDGMSVMVVNCSCGNRFPMRVAHFMAQRDMLLHYRLVCAGMVMVDA